MTMNIFKPYTFSEADRVELDRDGHFMFPGLLIDETCTKLKEALRNIVHLNQDGEKGHEPGRFAAEFDDYLESLIAHPQMLALARQILGENIRWDHCVSLVRAKSTPAMAWHTHDYAQARPELGFIRIFFYIDGFSPDDGGLKAVPGSHLFRASEMRIQTDEELESSWLKDKNHPTTGEPLAIEHLTAPPGTVIVMWTHALHGVNAKQADSPRRYCVVYAYRNPGEPSVARWISDAYEKKSIPGTEGLMSLY
ncbi:MAG: phytanoyl-CoA dioxygenase family protein [Pseudomonadota bacterium]